MSRKLSSTFCKSKQIPRIFQRRNQTVRSIVRNGWSSLDNVNTDGNISNVQASTSANLILESSENDSKDPYDDKRKRIREKFTSESVDYTTKILDTSIDDGNSCGLRLDSDETLHEKSIGTAGSVDDIEKWLKARTESVSSIELDAMKSVVEEEDDDGDDEEEDGNVGVNRYLADDLPHVFLGKDPDGLSIDIDLSDKKLNLDYDPLLREMQSDKLLEACEKNDEFILPEFRLDHLDPLVLSPHDMMVAGEILPSTSHQPNSSKSVQQMENSTNNAIANDNDNSRDSDTEELADKPVQSDVYNLTEELEEIAEEIDEEIEFKDQKLDYSFVKDDQSEILRTTKVTEDSEVRASIENEIKSKTMSKLEPRIMKKRRKIRPKPERNEITFLGEPCHIDGKDGVMAVVAISTDKISNMTQIVINTGIDEQIYQGKTSELIEATGNFPKMSKIDIDAESFLTRDRPHERMVSKALEELGITDESLEPALITESGRSWLCPRDECNREFCKLHALKAHLLAHYGVRPFKCDYEGCTWAFHSEFKLKRHKETHLKRKNFVCEVAGCNRRFTTVYNLWSHEKLHTRPNRIVCQVPNCHEKFQTKRALELHMKNHDQSHAPYLCDHESCGKRYYTSNALTSHQRCHNYKEIDVKCSWPGCGKIFDKPCRLKAHVRSHTGSKPYSCTYQDCQWAFSSSSKLKRHQKKHTNERKFVCNVDACGKAFMRSEHLKEHLLTHAGGGFFQCYMCDAHFSAKSSLYVHIKKHQIKEAVDTITDSVEKVHKRKFRDSRVTMQNFVPKISVISDGAGIEEYHGNSSYREMPMDNTENLRTSVDKITRKTVRKERNELPYNCGMEGCGKSYGTLSSLGSHMLASHGSSMENETPSDISAVTEASDLDYIMYATPSSNSNGACRTMMLDSCNAIIMSEMPKNIVSSPEPEPSPSVRVNPRETPDNGRRICQGSARTGLTCEDVWKLKARINVTETTNVGASDVVLSGAGINEGLLLTEELPSMYYQDDMVGTECQILLLDNGSSENPIDLRGLE